MSLTSSHIKPTNPIWTWPNLIGLDAPVVAVCWQWMFAHSFGINLPTVIYYILALSVWCIYLADRMIDVLRANVTDQSTSRHRFTKQYFGKLIAVIVTASVINLILIINHVPLKLWVYGGFTAGLIAVYYLIRFTKINQHITLIPREILCGFLFSIGCAIAPLTFAPNETHFLPYSIAILIFGALCSMNCILISIWENQADLASNDPSAFTAHSRLIPHIASSISALAIISALLSFLFVWKFFIAISLAALCFKIALYYQDRLQSITLRVLADASLLTPLLFLMQF